MTYMLCDDRKKEVIDGCSGDRLGFPDDVVIESCGTVLFITLAKSGFCLPFGKSEPRKIPWKCIERITEDTIWVKE